MERGSYITSLLLLAPMILQAAGIFIGLLSDFIDRVHEQVLPDLFMDILSVCIFDGSFPRCDAAVSTVCIPADIGCSDQPTAVVIGGGSCVDIHNRAEFVQPEEFP